MKMSKKGISLITLVIIIIIMIILAGAILLTLSNSKIFDKANDAVDRYNSKQNQIKEDLDWAEGYLDGETPEDGGNKVVPDDWKENVWELTGDDVPIPKGFVRSPYKGEGTKNEGLVIYALTEDEVKRGVNDLSADPNMQYSLENRNQFVWVPVDKDKFKTIFKRYDFMNNEYVSNTAIGINRWEVVVNEENIPDQEANKSSYMPEKTLEEVTAMYKSVAKYGGFYIARYEVGTEETEIDDRYGYIAKRGAEISVTMGKKPYNLISWDDSMTPEELSEGAVTLARSFYPSQNEYYGAVSTLTYGVQWDRLLLWIKERRSDITLNNSTNNGVYLDTSIESGKFNTGALCSVFDTREWKFTEYKSAIPKASMQLMLTSTGAFKDANLCNTYDVGGNLAEWTMEAWTKTHRIILGGHFTDRGSNLPLIGEILCPEAGFVELSYCFGFRPALYIK